MIWGNESIIIQMIRIIGLLSYHVNLLTWRTLAEKPSVLIDTLGSGSTGVAQTFIEVHTLEGRETKLLL